LTKFLPLAARDEAGRAEKLGDSFTADFAEWMRTLGTIRALDLSFCRSVR
jgi:hypothetical protein